MAARLWAEIDDDWKRKEERALAQRAANAAAAREGRPLPCRNPLVGFDRDKLSPDASTEEYHQWYLRRRKICRAPKPQRHPI